MPELATLMGFRNEVRHLVQATIGATAQVEISDAALRGFTGSAWRYDDDHWITNHHVVDGSRGSAMVNLRGERLQAVVVGADEETDLAVIRFPEPTGAPALVVSSEHPQVGELCFAFGSPLDYQDSVTMGIVSGVGRRSPNTAGTTVEDVLQIDAALNHGNSGGPLVDVAGEVIGVNFQVDPEANNISFAIPAATVRAIAPELIEHGEVARATLGLSVAVQPGSHFGETLCVADASGPFRAGDQLVSVNGQSIRRRADLFKVMNRSVIDREIPVVVRRGDQELEVEARPSRKR